MSLGLHLAKIRLSERKTKYIEFFRAGVPWTDRSKDTIMRANSKENLNFSLLVSSQQSCRDISPFTLLRSKAMLTLFVLKDVVQVGHDDLQVFVECKFYILDDFQRSLFIIICKGCESSELFGNDCVVFCQTVFLMYCR